jgi:hypothetical protein
MSEVSMVHRALRCLGFVGMAGSDWIYQSEGVLCAIPPEYSGSFANAAKFLAEGAFQSTLKKATRAAYLRLSTRLREAWAQYSKEGTIGAWERTKLTVVRPS